MLRRALCFLVLLLANGVTVADSPRDLPKISARSWVMMDINSGYLLSKNNEYLPLHPGELTKLMSAYVMFRTLAADNIGLDQVVTIDGSVQATNGPRIFLQPGERMRIDALLAAMLVHGANDATLALAKHFAGSEKAFVERMNRQARVLGMTRSHFMNATGLPDLKQASTAADLALLSQAIVRQFPQYQDFFRTRKINHLDINYYNRNAMLWRDADAEGLMASPNQATGYHLVAASNRENQNLVVVILGAKNEQRLFEAGQALLDFGRRTWETRLLYPARKVMAEVPITDGASSSVAVGTLDALYVTIPRGTGAELQVQLDVEQGLPAPVEQGQDAGNLTLTFQNEVLAEYPLVALQSVPVGNAVQKTWGDFRNWLRDDRPGTDDGGAGNPAAAQE